MASVLMRETVAGGRWPVEEGRSVGVGWKAVPSVAERRPGAWLVCCGLKR